jgi:hypothetical protein
MVRRSARPRSSVPCLAFAASALLAAAASAQFASHPAQVDNLPPAPALDDGETLWPQVSAADGTTFVLYSPQFASIVGTQGTARAAFSAARDGEAPVYGSVTFTAALDNDLSSGLIHVSDMLVQGATRADGKDPSSTVAVLQRMLMGANFTVQRSAALENMDLAGARAADPALSNAPPAIRAVGRAAVMIALDGPPVLRAVAPGVGIAANTPSLLAFDASARTWFTRVGTSTWLSAASWKGPFAAGAAPAPDALRAIEAALPARAPGVAPPPMPAPARVPEVVVVTEPTVLVSMDGGPDLVQVADGIYGVRNAGCDLFTSADGNTWWTLASGRWFTTGDLMDGPWSYVEPSALPKAFAQVDPKGSWGSVLASVPGTLAAKDAAYQQSIPHVATLDRAKARGSAKVAWLGGAPRFAPVAGTSLTVGANATAPVVQCDGAYYLCTDGAWCVASRPDGPWELCDAVPESVYAIPPSSPAYCATFVRVANATAESVTFAFTAGYANSFPNGGIVSYGTGFASPGARASDAGGPGSVDPGDGATWGSYAGAPVTYACPMALGVTGWTCQGLPGWTDYALQCAPTWATAGWWGPGSGFDTGFALGMGFAGAWEWGYHPWGSADADGWWRQHWSGAYARGWATAVRSANRAANAGVRPASAPAPTGWAHAAGADDNVSSTPDGRVTQQRGAQTFVRASGGWQAASAGPVGVAPAAPTASQPGGFYERDGSAPAVAAARATTMDDFRPDPNHDFDGSPRGAFTRGETNYADRREALEPPSQGGAEPGDYRRGGSWNGGGYDRRDQPRGDWQAPQQGGEQGAPRNDGYPGWSSGERGYGRTSGYTGARGVTDSWNHGWSRFGGTSDQYWRFSGEGAKSGYTGGIYYNSSGPLRSGYTGGGLGVNNSMFGWPWGGGMYGGNYRYGNFAGGMPMGIMR